MIDVSMKFNTLRYAKAEGYLKTSKEIRGKQCPFWTKGRIGGHLKGGYGCPPPPAWEGVPSKIESRVSWSKYLGSGLRKCACACF